MAHLAHRPALELLDLINKKLLNPRNLHRPERLNIVDTLRLEGWSQARIAQLLSCGHRTVNRDVRELKRRSWRLVKDFTRERVAGESIAIAEAIRQQAIINKKPELAWQITKELPALMQTLALLPKAPEQIEVNVQSRFIAEIVRRSQEGCGHVDGDGQLKPARN